MAIYAKFTALAGNVNVPNYKDWVAFDSMSFGVQRSVSMKVGALADRTDGFPKFSEITFYKKADTATIDIFRYICNLDPQRNVEIHVCANTSDTADPKPDMTYIFSNVVISNHQHFIASQGLPTEEVTLTYAKVELSYLGRDSSNKPVTPQRGGYDLEKATRL